MNMSSGYDVKQNNGRIIHNLEGRIFVTLLVLISLAFGGYVIYLMYVSVNISER